MDAARRLVLLLVEAASLLCEPRPRLLLLVLVLHRPLLVPHHLRLAEVALLPCEPWPRLPVPHRHQALLHLLPAVEALA